MTHHRLHINTLACQRSDVLLFDNVTFSVNSGDCLQVVGPNGCGKTSLLKIMVGLLSPFRGDVLWGDLPISQVRPEYYSNLLYLGHKLGVKRDLTILENLTQSLVPLSNSTDAVQSALKSVQLHQYQDKLCAELSRGQCQRLALARLWLSDARVWILDEPFSGLDSAFVLIMQQKMLSHLQSGGLIVLTTHQPLTLNALKATTFDLALFNSAMEAEHV